ncbi:MAG: hypothetical protein ACRDHZ_07175 [Ktedonobacteraceae bacterium]
MPVSETTDTQSLRSALRYRPLASAPNQSIVTTATHPVVQRASRPKGAADELVSEWQLGDTENTPSSPPRAPTKVAAQRKRSNLTPKSTPQTPTRRATGWRVHPLLLLGLGMLAMLVLWLLLNVGLNWWNDAMDTMHYGYPRTYQIDVQVGHNDSANNPSHFLATNIHGHIEIIEFPGGDGTHARIYLGPQLFGPDADKAPVTLQFADINGDHKPDMFVFFQASWIVLINDQGSFRAPTPQEHQDAVAYLSAHGQSS